MSRCWEETTSHSMEHARSAERECLFPGLLLPNNIRRLMRKHCSMVFGTMTMVVMKWFTARNPLD